MRKLLNFFVYAVTLGIICFVGLGYWVLNEYKKPGPLREQIVFIVEKGENAGTIAERLEQKNVIQSADIFRFGLRYLDDNNFLKAGEYELEPGLSMKDVIATLQTGRTIEYKFTIPECATSYEAMNTINDIEILSGSLLKPPLEGSIFPDTYHYVRGEEKRDVVKRMQDKMNGVLERLWRLHGGSKYLTSPQEAMILASIVEKEAGKPEERAKVAGLYINRLGKGMRLQSDPTVIYGIVDGRPKTDGQGPLGRRMTRKDWEFDSPYNTYIYPGLPPGPICNPGEASIEAVLNPEKHDYIYMVADGTGGHAFAKTLREHNQNVAKWRKVRAAQEAQ